METNDSIKLIDQLSKPEFYSHKPSKVDIVQTQMSIIFLTGKFAYKIKKPVNLGYLDYTTLERRKYFCYQELELNRRLSPDVYIEVLAITENNGNIRFNGEGTVIEYALKMRQLPNDRTMDYLLLKNQVTVEMVERVAEKMARFHEGALTNKDISQFGTLNAIWVNVEENKKQIEKYVGTTISVHEYIKINQYNDSFKNDNGWLFEERVKTARIRDCHGDLHAAHICFDDDIVIYDCIEFNDRFRYCDVASEIAFLAMDIERYQRADLSRIFCDAYVKFSKDVGIHRLLNFYKCYRACVRGKVESFKLDDPLIINKDLVIDIAKQYFHLAYKYTMKKPMLIILSGLMGTGKSSLALALSQETGFKVISSDVVRKKLAGVPLDEHKYEEFDRGIYSNEFTRRTYDEMLIEAKYLLSMEQSVILDASFKRRRDRELAKQLAEESKADFLIVECILEEEEVKRRLDKRLKEGSVSDGRWEIFNMQKQDFDRITEVSEQSHIIVDTILPVRDGVNRVLERI